MSSAASPQGVFCGIWGSVFSSLSGYSSSTEALETKLGDIQPWRWARGLCRARVPGRGAETPRGGSPQSPIGLQQLSTKSKAARKVGTVEHQLRPFWAQVSACRSQPCAGRVPSGGDHVEAWSRAWDVEAQPRVDSPRVAKQLRRHLGALEWVGHSQPPPVPSLLPAAVHYPPA